VQEFGDGYVQFRAAVPLSTADTYTGPWRNSKQLALRDRAALHGALLCSGMQAASLQRLLGVIGEALVFYREDEEASFETQTEVSDTNQFAAGTFPDITAMLQQADLQWDKGMFDFLRRRSSVQVLAELASLKLPLEALCAKQSRLAAQQLRWLGRLVLMQWCSLEAHVRQHGAEEASALNHGRSNAESDAAEPHQGQETDWSACRPLPPPERLQAQQDQCQSRETMSPAGSGPTASATEDIAAEVPGSVCGTAYLDGKLSSCVAVAVLGWLMAAVGQVRKHRLAAELTALANQAAMQQHATTGVAQEPPLLPNEPGPVRREDFSRVLAEALRERVLEAQAASSLSPAPAA